MFNIQLFTTPSSGLTSAQFIGVENFTAAELTSDTATTTSYGTPLNLGKVLRRVKVTPQSNTQDAYADDVIIDTVTDVAKFDLEVETAALPLEYIAWLLGHEYQDGVMSKKKDDAAPYFAIMYQSNKRNGKARYTKFYKVQFAEPDNENKTKQENIEFQFPTLKATAIHRLSDGKAYDYADDEDPNFTGKSTWYTTV